MSSTPSLPIRPNPSQVRQFHAPGNGNQDQHLCLSQGLTVSTNIQADIVAGSNTAMKDLDGSLGGTAGAVLVPLRGCIPTEAYYKDDVAACPRVLDPIFDAVPGISCTWVEKYLFHSCTGLRLQVRAHAMGARGRRAWGLMRCA